MKGSFPTSFGIEVTKTDLDLLPDTMLANLVLEHKLILVRSLSLTPDELIKYGRKFGQLYLSGSDLKGNGEAVHVKSMQHPEITVLSRTGLHENALIDWHIDLIHKPSGPMLPGRILYAHETDAASTTNWTDTERAYEFLDDQTRNWLDPLLAFYAAPYRTQWIGAARRIVFENPLTKRRALWLDKTFAQCVIGTTYEDTDALKTDVFARSLVDENIYQHEWRKGDLIIYDNNGLMHQRETIATDAPGERTIWRLTFDYL